MERGVGGWNPLDSLVHPLHYVYCMKIKPRFQKKINCDCKKDI